MYRIVMFKDPLIFSYIIHFNNTIQTPTRGIYVVYTDDITKAKICVSPGNIKNIDGILLFKGIKLIPCSIPSIFKMKPIHLELATIDTAKGLFWDCIDQQTYNLIENCFTTLNYYVQTN